MNLTTNYVWLQNVSDLRT